MRKRTKLVAAVLYLGAGQAYVKWRSKVSGKAFTFDGFKEYTAEHDKTGLIANNERAARMAWNAMYGMALATWPGLAVRRAVITVKEMTAKKPEQNDR